MAQLNRLVPSILYNWVQIKISPPLISSEFKRYFHCHWIVKIGKKRKMDLSRHNLKKLKSRKSHCEIARLNRSPYLIFCFNSKKEGGSESGKEQRREESKSILFLSLYLHSPLQKENVPKIFPHDTSTWWCWCLLFTKFGCKEKRRQAARSTWQEGGAL